MVLHCYGIWLRVRNSIHLMLVPGGIIRVLCFSPNKNCLCAATEEGVKIWDIESKSVVHDLNFEPDAGKNKVNFVYVSVLHVLILLIVQCICLFTLIVVVSSII